MSIYHVKVENIIEIEAENLSQAYLKSKECKDKEKMYGCGFYSIGIHDKNKIWILANRLTSKIISLPIKVSNKAPIIPGNIKIRSPEFYLKRHNTKKLKKQKLKNNI